MEGRGWEDFVGVVVHVAVEGVDTEVDAAFPGFIVIVKIVIVFLGFGGAEGENYSQEKEEYVSFHLIVKWLESIKWKVNGWQK